MIEDLKYLDWSVERTGQMPSLKYLFDEYMRRTIIWSKHSEYIGQGFLRHTNSESMLAMLTQDDLKVIEHVVFPDVITHNFVKLIVSWEVFRKRNKIILNELPNLYEPLVKFYLRGGIVRITPYGYELGTLASGLYLSPRGSMTAYTKVVPRLDLSDNVLDAMNSDFTE